MNTDNEYYTPSIEEIHEGLSLEVQRGDNIWITCIFRHRIPNAGEDIFQCISKGWVRVKRLYHEDIIECGWEDIEEANDGWRRKYQNGSQSMKVWWHTQKPTTVEIENELSNVVFSGTIANISELRRIMKQVGI